MLRSGHGHLAAELLILASLVSAILAGCDTLTVLDGYEPIDPDTICIKRFKSNECAAFLKSYDMKDLPPGYPNTGPGVDKPEELVLNILSTIREGSVYPSIAIKWKSPKSAESRERCVGYFVVWHYRAAPTILCNLLLFNTSNPKIKDELYFQYTLAVKDLSFYTVEVHSMPTFPTIESGGFAFGSISTPSIYSINVGHSPGEWYPYITYSAFTNGTLVVRFTLPPADYNLKRFSVLLMDEGELRKPLYDVDIFPGLRTNKTTHASTTLEVKKSGCYFIVVQVRELEGHRLVPEKCSCYVLIEVKRCKPSCGSVQLGACMNVTESSLQEKTTGGGPGGSQTTAQPSDRSRTLNSRLALSITTGMIAAVLFIMFVFFLAFCLRHGSSVFKCCKKKPQKPPPKPKDVNNSWSVSDPAEPSDLTNVVPLTEKTVYIIYASDHQPHLQVVESLIAFLNVHCRCRVVSLMQCDCDESEIYQWFLTRISTADYIIFLDSKGAESLIAAFLNHKICRAKRSRLEDDLFHYGVKYLMNSEEVRENNLILVSFHGKYCQKYLQVPTLYTLPKDLLGLLQKLHNLNVENIKAYDGWLPLHVANIPKLPEGARLLSAIRAVEDFEQSNPGWFEKKSGLMKLLSEDAGYSSDATSGSSLASTSKTGLVSIHDPESSEFDTPVSVFGELDFTIFLHANDPQGPTGPQSPPHVQSCTDSRSCNPEKELNEANLYTISDKLNAEGISDTVPWSQLNKLPREMGHAVNLESKSLDGESLIPPEALSEIMYDTYSTALAQINTNGEFISHHLQSQTDCAGNGSIMDPTIDGIEFSNLNELKLTPPETLSDIQEENMSVFFRDINANTEKCLAEFNI